MEEEGEKIYRTNSDEIAFSYAAAAVCAAVAVSSLSPCPLPTFLFVFIMLGSGLNKKWMCRSQIFSIVKIFACRSFYRLVTHKREKKNK